MNRVDFSLMMTQPPLGMPAHAAFLPIPTEFQQEPGVIFLFSDTPDVLTDVIKGGSATGHINNILILGRGKHVWLVDPMKSTPPTPPAPPSQPAPTGPPGGTGATGPSGP
jgi:hypothetical protein